MEHLTRLIKLANRLYAEAQDDDVALLHHFIKNQINVVNNIQKQAQFPDMKPTIVLVRHGNTDFNDGNAANSAERLRGWLDIPLSDKGCEQAERVAQFLSTFPISRIVCSDLSRSRDTAKAIQRYTNAAIEDCPALRPWNLGICMGKEVDHYLPVMLEHMKQENAIPPGSTESFAHFIKRFIYKVKEMMSEVKENPQRGIVVLVAHSRNTRCLRDFILGGADSEVFDKPTLFQKEDPVKTGGLMAVQFNGTSWEIVQLPHQTDLDDKASKPITLP